MPEIASGATSVWHLYVIRTKQRDELQAYLHSKGIGTLIHYPIPPHLQEAYQHLGYQRGSFPLAEEISATALSLPLFPGLNEDDVMFITEEIKNFFML